MENIDNTADRNSIVPKSLINKVNEEDSEESFEDVYDDSYFDGNNDDNIIIAAIYKNRNGAMWFQNSGKPPHGRSNVRNLYGNTIGLHSLFSIE